MIGKKQIKIMTVVTGAMLAIGAIALAQGPGRGRAFAGPGGFGPGGFGGPGFGFGGGKVVTGAAFSATAVSTFTETLANGNLINRASCAQLYRDSSGRTRQDVTTNSSTCSSTPQSTIIRDPVAGVEYTINNTKSTYRQITLKAPPQSSTPPNRPSPPNSGQVQTTTLGPQSVTIGGTTLTEQGTQTVRTIPAGQIGNAQPIVITSTVWNSTELQIVLSSLRNDPSGGNSSYQINSITLGEPSVSFQPPPNFTQQQGFSGQARRGH